MNIKMNINKQDIEVANLLRENNIETDVIYCGVYNDPDWQADKWLFKIGDQSFDYKTGFGHRIKPTKFKGLNYSDKQELKKLKELYDFKTRDKAAYEISGTLDYAVIPTQAGVLYCLLLDAQASDESFKNWCSDFGYDSDSMKAFKIYQDCCENGDKLSKVLSRDLIEQLTKILEDY